MNRFTLSHLATGFLLAASAAGVQAAEVSQQTDTVQGRAPVANSVVIGNQSYPHAGGARVGHMLSIGYGFEDADGDVDSGSAFQWLRNGAAISGATASTYTVQSTDVNRSLSVQITPKTDPAITDPASGVVVTSAAVTVTTGAVDYGNFLAPDTVRRTWSQADSYCKSKGARLPIVGELQQLFVDATSSPAWSPNSGYTSNNEMCALYGWPLNGVCGGVTGSGSYWASDRNGASTHRGANLISGAAFWNDDTSVHLVACVR